MNTATAAAKTSGLKLGSIARIELTNFICLHHKQANPLWRKGFNEGNFTRYNEFFEFVVSEVEREGVFNIRSEMSVDKEAKQWRPENSRHVQLEMREAELVEFALNHDGVFDTCHIPWSTPAGSGYSGHVLRWDGDGWQSPVGKFATVAEYIATWHSTYNVINRVFKRHFTPAIDSK